MQNSGMKLIDWNGEHYFVTLANLWANLISNDPPELPQLIIGWWENINMIGIKFAKCQIWDKDLGLAHHVNWRLLCRGWSEGYKLLLSRALAFGLFWKSSVCTRVCTQKYALGQKSWQIWTSRYWVQRHGLRFFTDGSREMMWDTDYLVFVWQFFPRYVVVKHVGHRPWFFLSVSWSHCTIKFGSCVSCMYWCNLMFHP